MNRFNYRILFFNGIAISEEYAQPFSNSPLHDIENDVAKLLSKQRQKRTQSTNDICNTCNLFKRIPVKFAQLKIKLFNILFKKFFLPGKAPKSGNIVCFYVDSDIKPSSDTSVYLAKSKPLKIIKYIL